MIRRVTIATLAGVLMGLVCWFGAVVLLGADFGPSSVASTLYQRAMMGFVIGISALRMNWQAHGLLIGLIIGASYAFTAYFNADQTGLGIGAVLALVPLGAAYGWAIEAITTRLFNAPAPR